MNASESHAAAPIPFAGAVMDRDRHVCAFFASAEEAYTVTLPFIKDGIARGVFAGRAGRRRSRARRRPRE